MLLRSIYSYSALFISIAALSGCATKGNESTGEISGDQSYQFDPIPVEEVGTQTLDPVTVVNATQLLEQATLVGMASQN